VITTTEFFHIPADLEHVARNVAAEDRWKMQFHERPRLTGEQPPVDRINARRVNLHLHVARSYLWLGDVRKCQLVDIAVGSRDERLHGTPFISKS